MSRWEVQQNIGGNWENTWHEDEMPWTFSSRKEAEQELEDFLEETREYPFDYRIVPIPDKVKAYRAGMYTFPPPPVCTAGWNEVAWIKYIDEYGHWHMPDPGCEYTNTPDGFPERCRWCGARTIVEEPGDAREWHECPNCGATYEVVWEDEDD